MTASEQARADAMADAATLYGVAFEMTQGGNFWGRTGRRGAARLVGSGAKRAQAIVDALAPAFVGTLAAGKVFAGRAVPQGEKDVREAARRAFAAVPELRK